MRTLSVLLLVAFLPLWGAEAPPPLRLMALGDSLTAWNGAWRHPLQELLEARGLAVDFVGTQRDAYPGNRDGDHEGYSGHRVDNILDRLYGNPHAWGGPVEANEAVKRCQPDLVIVLLGTNDLRQGRWPEASAPSGGGAVLDGYGQLVERVLADAPHARVFVCGLPPNTLDRLPEHIRAWPEYAACESVNDLIPAFNRALREQVVQMQASGRRVSWIEGGAVLSGEDLRDGIHPTDTGFRKLAAAIFEGLEPYLP